MNHALNNVVYRALKIKGMDWSLITGSLVLFTVIHNHYHRKCWKNGISTRKRMKFHPYLIPYTKINSKGIKVLKIRAKTRELLANVKILNLAGISWK